MGIVPQPDAIIGTVVTLTPAVFELYICVKKNQMVCVSLSLFPNVML